VKKVIMCVDDERIVLNSLKSLFMRRLGEEFAYEMAEDAEEALALIDELCEEDVKILVIISDWLMPGMKGDEFLIRVHEKHPDIVKVMITGQADEESISKAVNKANLLRCFHKPWDDEELILTIRKALED
jgi:DNA-binding NtrC family response regulator